MRPPTLGPPILRGLAQTLRPVNGIDYLYSCASIGLQFRHVSRSSMFLVGHDSPEEVQSSSYDLAGQQDQCEPYMKIT